MGIKKTMRGATDGDVLYRWLQGVKAKSLTPFFMKSNRKNSLSCGELPLAQYYPIAGKNNTSKSCKNHRVAYLTSAIYPFIEWISIWGGTILG